MIATPQTIAAGTTGGRAVTPFRIAVADAVLRDLQSRLSLTRWSTSPHDAEWDAGTSSDFLRKLLRYWLAEYDWRANEAALNQLPHYKADVDGGGIHFIHARGKGPKPFPLLLTHGYPDSFHRFTKLIPLLTDPAAYGGSAEDSFDVVVPDLPGYGFSDKPTEAGAFFKVPGLWASLMQKTLGYAKFGAQGGDWGSTVTELLAQNHADAVVAIHLTDVPFGHTMQKPSDLSPAEEKFFRKTEGWLQKEGAYALIQSTRPQSLAPGMNDSPVGLAAWLVEKFQRWSDCDGDVERRFSKDELLTHIMIYWVTESIGTSFAPYYDYANAGAVTWAKEAAKKWLGSASVPAAFALFPKDIAQPPREFAARFFNVQRWSEMPRGGHYAAWEEPELLAADLREWFRPFRSAV